MKAQVGLYKFGRHRNLWGIWQYDWVSETGTSARFIKDVFSYDEAVREVYRLNGWVNPILKQISIKNRAAFNGCFFVISNDSHVVLCNYVYCDNIQ